MLEHQIVRIAVAGRIVGREGEERAMIAVQRFAHTVIVKIRHHVSALRHKLGKGTERALHIGQVLKEVKVVGLHVEEHRNGGVEA